VTDRELEDEHHRRRKVAGWAVGRASSSKQLQVPENLLTRCHHAYSVCVA